MSLIEDIRKEVQEISKERGLAEDRAFGYWFLERYEDLSPEEAESIITDGPWDRGRDAVYLDEENRILKIYQSKYSEDCEYVKNALTDIQTGLIAERRQLPSVDTVNLEIVTIASASAELHSLEEKVERRIKNWLRRNRYQVEVRVEMIDLRRFLELSERLYGVDVSLEWGLKNVVNGQSIIGLLNAAKLKDYVDREELFSLNIRRFLGIRKGSVSWKIKQSLEDEEKRDMFWILNNGIVCLCTDFFEEKSNIFHFKNFTIVNGAQTINTIAKFLEENPVVNEPIWVVAKVLKVSETEIELAAEITGASNTQTPTSTRDLRATDLVHSRIREWLRSEFNLEYIYKRGQKAANPVKMKDLAQAYVSFWLEEPHVSFSRPGQIFANDAYYEEVFPPKHVDELKRKGRQTEIRDFLLQRLLPWKITIRTREYLRKNTGPGTKYPDKKFRSLTYHMTWLFKKILEEKLDDNFEGIYQNIKNIMDEIEEPLFREIYSFLTYSNTEIPRSLKSTAAKEKMIESFILSSQFQAIRKQALQLII